MGMFAGAWTALVTPFRNDAVDERALRDLVEDQVQASIDGLMPCGTTGESVNLSHAEYVQVLRVVIDQVKGRVPVCPGVGTASTRHSIELRAAPPRTRAPTACSWSRRTTTGRRRTGLCAHFEAIAQRRRPAARAVQHPGPHRRRHRADHARAPGARAVDRRDQGSDRQRHAQRRHRGALRRALHDPVRRRRADRGRSWRSAATAWSAWRRTSCPATSRASCTSSATATSRARARSSKGCGPLYEALFMEASPGPVKAALAMCGGSRPNPLAAGAADRTDAASIRAACCSAWGCCDGDRRSRSRRPHGPHRARAPAGRPAGAPGRGGRSPGSRRARPGRGGADRAAGAAARAVDRRHRSRARRKRRS